MCKERLLSARPAHQRVTQGELKEGENVDPRTKYSFSFKDKAYEPNLCCGLTDDLLWYLGLHSLGSFSKIYHRNAFLSMGQCVPVKLMSS